jgi:hypothetical protein
MVEFKEVRNKTRMKPADACIYCGATAGLTDEHVVPLGLAGNLILPKASCPKCSAITSKFERDVQRGFMLLSRSVGDFPTRRPKERPKTIKYEAERNGIMTPVELPLAEAGSLLPLPKFDPPSFLSGGMPVTGIKVCGIETISFGKTPTQIAAALGCTTLRFTENIEPTAFARMLAKIGYAFSVGVLGRCPPGEVPALPLILGTANDAGTWVGSTIGSDSGAGKGAQHLMGLVQHSAVVNGIAETILVAQVTLFATAGASGYDIVVRRSVSAASATPNP